MMLVSSLEGVLPKSSHDFLVINFARIPRFIGLRFFRCLQKHPRKLRKYEEETFQDKTGAIGAIAMAILRGQDGPNIRMMACIPTNDSTVFTCAGRMRCFFSENVTTIA